jgi:hypothetical protein
VNRSQERSEGQLDAAAELLEAQVRLGYPAPPFGPPVREGSRRAEVGHAADAGQLTGIGGDPLHDRGRPGWVGHRVRPAGMIAFGAQVDHLGELPGMQAGQPAGALAQSARLIEQAVADQVAPAQLGIVSSPPGSSGAGQPAARSSPSAASSPPRSASAAVGQRGGSSLPPIAAEDPAPPHVA